MSFDTVQRQHQRLRQHLHAVASSTLPPNTLSAGWAAGPISCTPCVSAHFPSAVARPGGHFAAVGHAVVG